MDANINKMICVVIPVHNRRQFTKACLHSLHQQTIPADVIIVVDDGSVDGTKEMISTDFPNVILLLGDGSLYWTAAINIGIKLALKLDADYVITLNDDTVATPNFIEKMLLRAEENPTALLGALDLDIKTKKPYYGGEIFNWSSGKSKYLLNTLHIEDHIGLHEVSLLPARGLLIPRKVLKTIGLFEEKLLPHYMADYDFTQRARNKGFKIYCNYDAKIYTYPEEGGDHKIRKQKSIKNYFNHLFSIKGGGNLKNFTIYAFRNCPRNEILSALLSGYIRRIGGFWIR